MQQYRLFTHAACVALGLGLGYLWQSNHAVPTESAKLTHAPLRSRADHEARSSAQANPVITKSILNRIPKDYTERQAWLKNFDIHQSAEILEALAEQAGIDGLDYSQHSDLNTIFDRWNTADPQAALSWAKSIKHERNRHYFFKKILEPLLESNPQMAEQLSADIATQDSSWDHQKLIGDLAQTQLELAWKKENITAEELLKIYEKYPWGNSTSGSELKHYPSDFDFRQFLDGMTAKINSGSNRTQPSHLPTDILKNWAMREPQEALDWLCRSLDQKAELPFQDFQDIYAAVAKSQGATAAEQLLQEALLSPNENLFRNAYQSIDNETLTNVLPNIPAGEKKDQLITRLSNDGDETNTSQFCHLLAQMSSADATLKFLQSYRSNEDSSIMKKVAKLSPAQWRQIRLTPEQFRSTPQ